MLDKIWLWCQIHIFESVIFTPFLLLSRDVGPDIIGLKHWLNIKSLKIVTYLTLQTVLCVPTFHSLPFLSKWTFWNTLLIMIFCFFWQTNSFLFPFFWRKTHHHPTSLFFIESLFLRHPLSELFISKRNMPTKGRVYIFRYLCNGQSNHLILVQFCQKKSYNIYFLVSSKYKTN